MHVLMESLKIKDEMTASAEAAPAPPKQKAKAKAKKPPQKPARHIVRLERAPMPPPPKRKVRPMFIATALALFVILTAAIFIVPMVLEKSRSAEKRYENLIDKVENTKAPDEKVSLLESYLKATPYSPHKTEIESRIEQARQEIEDHEFEKITLQVSKLEVNENYEKQAISLYARFLEKYPNSRHTERINANIADIKNLLDQYYYEELKRAARLDFKDRLATYRDYVSKFPQGRYRRDVETLIEEMGRQYFDYLRTEAKQCEQNKRWEPCIERAQAFIETYTGSELADEAQRLRAELADKRDLFKLRETAQEAGNDYLKAHKTYQDYLEKHPRSTQKDVIQKEMKALEQHLDAQRKWIAVRNFATNPANDIFKRIQGVDRYLQTNLTGPYAADAQDLMNQLEVERKSELRQRQIAAKQQEELLRLQREKEKIAQQQKQARRMRGG